MAEAIRRSAPPRGWRARRMTLEAAALLVAARLLVGCVRFARWRGWLGAQGRNKSTREDEAAAWTGRYVGRTVERAASRLPFATKCLPRAMVAHWMLGRRGIESRLVVAVRRGDRGTGLNDLHAWVEAGGALALGAIDGDYAPVAAFHNLPTQND